MYKTLYSQISDCIERSFDIGGVDLSKKIIVFPCGEIGMQAIGVLKNVYNIEPAYLIDNHKCRYNPNIKEQSFLLNIPPEEYVVFLTSIDLEIYLPIRDFILKHFPKDRILELESMQKTIDNHSKWSYRTKIGRYSYGPICRNHPLISSIGSFDSFAWGVEVVANHEMAFISTHPFIYSDDYDMFEDAPWHIRGITPKLIGKKLSERGGVTIGSDVWLGCNVIVTNGSSIGNGVIAGAGAVITKDVPDYAVVAGVPARVIRYRYNPEQIKALNKIAWWDWSDDEIRERFDDFYLPIDDFIKKYL